VFLYKGGWLTALLSAVASCLIAFDGLPLRLERQILPALAEESPRKTLTNCGVAGRIFSIVTRQELVDRSEAYIRRVLKDRIPPPARIYLYGSRSRRDHRWNSDYDLWVDAAIPRTVIAAITDELEESFVPFKVDIVTTPQLSGLFADRVKREAKPWM